MRNTRPINLTKFRPLRTSFRAYRISSLLQACHSPCRQPCPIDLGGVSYLVHRQFSLHARYAISAKRPSRPFPPPFNSPPSTSFSDPLTTHDYPKAPAVPAPSTEDKIDRDQSLRGITNGDDAILIGKSYLGVFDGVGAWNSRDNGHAALWSRLLSHYFSKMVEGALPQNDISLDPVKFLQEAYLEVLSITSQGSRQWLGTSTACVAIVSGNFLSVANVGDSQCLVFRNTATSSETTPEVVFKSREQWHWFDCPRQLGTNSPDTPEKDASSSSIFLEDGDIVVLATDGLLDNLWDHEITDIIATYTSCTSKSNGEGLVCDREQTLADILVSRAKAIAQDPYAESPFMERAVNEGLAISGGKWDDISVIVATFRVSSPQ